MPIFEDKQMFRYTIPLLKDDNKILINDPVNDQIKLKEIEVSIINLIKENKYITRFELAEKLNISESTAKRYLSKLKNKKLIKRTGADKNGYWEIN